MTIEKVKQLNNGDEVFWTDPDSGACSRHITISSITCKGDIVQIEEVGGGYLECFARELS